MRQMLVSARPGGIGVSQICFEFFLDFREFLQFSIFGNFPFFLHFDNFMYSKTCLDRTLWSAENCKERNDFHARSVYR